MHFERKIEQDRLDVRSRSYFAYHCSICGHDEWLPWTPCFDTSRLRKCPKCGVEDDTNEADYLEKKLTQLDGQIAALQEEREQISTRLAVARAVKESETAGAVRTPSLTETNR